MLHLRAATLAVMSGTLMGAANAYYLSGAKPISFEQGQACVSKVVVLVVAMNMFSQSGWTCLRPS
jgi:hypothetical protein